MNEFRTFTPPDFKDLAVNAIQSCGRWLPHAALAAEFGDIAKRAASDDAFVSGCVEATKRMKERWQY